MHIAIGVLLAVLLIARLGRRATNGRQLPAADRGLLHATAKATHWSLYALLLATVSIGLLLAWSRGNTIFNLFTLPGFDPGNRDLVDQTQNVHATIGWIIVGLAGLHAAAALVHQYLWRVGLLTRMLPAPRS